MLERKTSSHVLLDSPCAADNDLRLTLPRTVRSDAKPHSPSLAGKRASLSVKKVSNNPRGRLVLWRRPFGPLAIEGTHPPPSDTLASFTWDYLCKDSSMMPMYVQFNSFVQDNIRAKQSMMKFSYCNTLGREYAMSRIEMYRRK